MIMSRRHLRATSHNPVTHGTALIVQLIYLYGRLVAPIVDVDKASYGSRIR